MDKTADHKRDWRWLREKGIVNTRQGHAVTAALPRRNERKAGVANMC